MEAVIALFIPIAFFIAIAVMFWLFFYFRYRNNVEIQKTLQAAIGQGQELTPEFLEKLSGHPESKKVMDLRRGVIAIALGVGIGIFGFVLREEDAFQPLLAVGAVPFILGLAYLGLWKLSPQE